MEQNLSNYSKHKLHCDGRKFLSISGVQKIESSNETQVVCIVENSPLLVGGKNLHVKKLDVEQGLVELDGQIDLIKYQPEKKSLMKRIFK